MKVYLLNPPAPSGIKMVREGRCMQRKGAWTTVWPPISLAYIAALLRENDCDVFLNDCIVEEINEDQTIDIIKKINPDLVIINTATASIKNDLAMADLIKKLDPRIKTAALGIHVSSLPEESLNMAAGLDFIIRGEPELTSLELIQAMRDKKDLSLVEGISFKRNGQVLSNKDRSLIRDLDSLPFPAWDLIEPGNYPMPFTDRPFLLLMSGKGCPYACTFCPAEPYYGKKVRLRSPQSLVDEMAWLKDKFGVKDFLIWSETFTFSRDFVNAVCNQIKLRKLEVSWVCNSRVDTVSLEMLKNMKTAGCWMVGFGVESGAQEILDRAKKETTIEQIRNAVSLTKEAGLEVTAHVIFGLPGETAQTARATIDFIKGLDIDFAQFYCVVPWPSTKIYQEAKQKNWLLSDDWSLYEQNYSVLNTDTISAEEVVKYRKQAIREFYFRPKIVWRTLRRIKSLKELKLFLGMLREFLTWT
ncbi:B12-binding domain-containing radical SAM protein [Candidatus Omnitrophota bacterium]